MRIKMLNAVVLGALLTIGSAAVNTASAQTSTAAGTARRAASFEKRKELREKLQAMTPEQRKVALQKAKNRAKKHRANMTDAQKAYATSRHTEMKTEAAAVKAGTITRETAAAQLKAWRAANPPPAKSGS
ncbi:MAG: hypothetical protein ABJB66_00485 [Gemmatimonadaceae bacterium]